MSLVRMFTTLLLIGAASMLGLGPAYADVVEPAAPTESAVSSEAVAEEEDDEADAAEAEAEERSDPAPASARVALADPSDCIPGLDPDCPEIPVEVCDDNDQTPLPPCDEPPGEEEPPCENNGNPPFCEEPEEPGEPEEPEEPVIPNPDLCPNNPNRDTPPCNTGGGGGGGNNGGGNNGGGNNGGGTEAGEQPSDTGQPNPAGQGAGAVGGVVPGANPAVREAAISGCTDVALCQGQQPVAEPRAAAGGGETLPDTGAPAGTRPLTMLATGLVLLGLVLLRWSRLTPRPVARHAAGR